METDPEILEMENDSMRDSDMAMMAGMGTRAQRGMAGITSLMMGAVHELL